MGAEEGEMASRRASLQDRRWAVKAAFMEARPSSSLFCNTSMMTLLLSNFFLSHTMFVYCCGSGMNRARCSCVCRRHELMNVLLLAES